MNNLINSTLVYATFPQSNRDVSIKRMGPPLKSLFPAWIKIDTVAKKGAIK